MNSSLRSSSQTSQSKNALAKAHAVRMERATIRRALRTTHSRHESLLLLADLFEQEVPVLMTVRIVWMVESCYQVGPSFVRSFRHAVKIGETSTLNDLSDKRRKELVSYLRYVGNRSHRSNGNGHV